jgi:hypothetical protein
VNQTIANIDITSLPQGDVTVTITSSGYIPRTYYYLFSPSVSNKYLNAYLLQSGQGVYITTLVYSTIHPDGIPGAIVAASKFINGSWADVSEVQTDSQGKGYLYLYPYIYYQIEATYMGDSSGTTDYYPNPNYVLYINMDENETAFTNATWLFDTVSVSFTPTEAIQSGIVTFTYQVTDTSSSLQYYFMNLTSKFGNHSVVLYTSNQTNSGGGSIAIQVNITNQSILGSHGLDFFVGFKRAGYYEWNTTYRFIFGEYYPTDTGWVFPMNLSSVLTDFKAGNFMGMTSDLGKQLLVVMLALGVAVGISKVSGNTFGATVAFLLVLVIFAMFGIFDNLPGGRWGFIIGLSVVGIGLWAWRQYS